MDRSDAVAQVCVDLRADVGQACVQLLARFLCGRVCFSLVSNGKPISKEIKFREKGQGRGGNLHA